MLTNAERLARARAQRSVLASLKRFNRGERPGPRTKATSPHRLGRVSSSRALEAPLTEAEALVLWAGVLRQAVLDADCADEQERRRARAWLVSPYAVQLAETVGLSADAWRWGVRRLLLGRRETPAPVESEVAELLAGA